MKTRSENGTSISANALAKRYNREWIFRKLTFDFHPGKIYAITGPNGSGKSTLLQVLCGVTPPSTGSLKYNDGDSLAPVEEIYHRVAIATPYLDLIEEFTLEEHVKFHFKLRPARNKMSIKEAIDRMSLTSSASKQIGNFSSGMRQRVRLGLALFTDADLVFLDEPGTNLDKTSFKWYESELAKLPSHCVTFIASNDPAEYTSAHHTLNILDFK